MLTHRTSSIESVATTNKAAEENQVLNSYSEVERR